MTFHYSDQAVLWAYHNDKPSAYNPSLQDLEAFDNDLHGKYEVKLVEEMTSAGIDVDKRTKSRILMLAKVSNGQSVRKKVRNACRYYTAAMSVLG